MQPTAIERTFAECNGNAALRWLLESDDVEPSEENADREDIGLGDEAEELMRGNLRVEDDGKTLVVSTKPQDDDLLGVSALNMSCAQDKLSMPMRLQESMSTTRAMDGRQSGEWDGYRAQWSYHPDNGMNLIIVAD